jgi:hypothetical protein
LKKLFKYFEPLWQGSDRRISLRSVGAMALMIDFVVNVHNASYVVIKVLNLITMDKTVDAAIIASLAGYLAQIALILGIEAGLIAALLALKTYQGNVEFLKSNTATATQTTTITTPATTIPPSSAGVEQVS